MPAGLRAAARRGASPGAHLLRCRASTMSPHRLRRAALHLPARRSRQNVTFIHLQALTISRERRTQIEGKIGMVVRRFIPISSSWDICNTIQLTAMDVFQRPCTTECFESAPINPVQMCSIRSSSRRDIAAGRPQCGGSSLFLP
jgi:hypothetical protein